MKLLPFLPILFVSFILRAENPVKLEGHTYPRQVEDHGVTWKIQGAEHFVYKLFFSVFTGAYYEEVDGRGERLHFTYTRDLKAKDLREQAMKALRNSKDKKSFDRYAKPLKGMQEAYVDVEDGDSYTITAIPGKGTWLELNGEKSFYTEDGEFGLWYLDIWLGDPPINRSLKKALTSGAHL